MTAYPYRFFLHDNDYGHLYGTEYPDGEQPRSSLRIYGIEELKKRITGNETSLVIPPFRVKKSGRFYINPREIKIGLGGLKQKKYRVSLVHNFQVEDNNPDLRECLAGIFLGGCRADGFRQEAEYYPFECRTIAILGWLLIPALPIETAKLPLFLS